MRLGRDVRGKVGEVQIGFNFYWFQTTTTVRFIDRVAAKPITDTPALSFGSFRAECLFYDRRDK